MGYAVTEKKSSTKKSTTKSDVYIWPNKRFMVYYGETSNVTFVDDVSEYSPETQEALDIMGIGTGPHLAYEHKIHMSSYEGKAPNWRNWESSARGFAISPPERVRYFKHVGVWDAISAAMDGGLITPDKAFMAPKLNVSDFEFLEDDELDRCRVIIETRVGEFWNCVMNFLHRVPKKDKDGEVVEDDRGYPAPRFKVSYAQEVYHRTLIDHSSFEFNGTTYANLPRLFSGGNKALSTANSWDEIKTRGIAKAVKNRKGLALFNFDIARTPRDVDERSASIGTSMDIIESLTVAEFAKKAGDSAVTTITVDSIRETLEANSNHRLNLWRASTGNVSGTLEDAVKELKKALLGKKKSVVYPRAADYKDILLPKTPAYLAKKYSFLIDTLAADEIPDWLKQYLPDAPKTAQKELATTFNDEDIPF